MAITALVAVMLSSNESVAAELMVVSSFAYGYISLMMLVGGIVSPYTQALLPLSLYYLLYHLIGSAFLLLSGGWLMGAAKGEILMQVASAASECTVEMGNTVKDFRTVVHVAPVHTNLGEEPYYQDYQGYQYNQPYAVTDPSNGYSTTAVDEGNETASDELEMKVPTIVRKMFTTPP
ncbi:hypothetical protein HPB49_020570 [Dermacentor silvarum]|uniref:Uncharacterized protein n=1 Tax=Dermacentor silvarum TaxID=543639 RepID=A0ACB8CMC2_DERSI|nr:hypothetical protein HPB49_020570 [Dermacentor silvarum]